MKNSKGLRESDNFENTLAVDVSDIVVASQQLKSAPIRESNSLDASPVFGSTSGFSGSQDWTSSNALAWSEAYPATLMIRSDNLGGSPGLGRSQALKYSLAFPRSSEITASFPLLESASFWTRLYDSARFDFTAVYAVSAEFSRSIAFSKSNGFGISEEATGSTWLKVSDRVNPSPGFGFTAAYAVSAELSRSIAFSRSKGLWISEEATGSTWLKVSDPVNPSQRLPVSGFVPRSSAWTPSEQIEASGRVQDSIKPPESFGLGESGRMGQSNELNATAAWRATSEFPGSDGLRKSNGLWQTGAYPPTVQVASRAFNANSESLAASIWWVASDAANETIGLHGTDAGPASEDFAYSSPLDKSIAFVGSMKWRTEDVGELHRSDSSQGFQAGYAAAMIIGILAIVVAGACLVVSQIRAQRSSSTEVETEMGTEVSIDQDESAVSWEDEEVNDGFVWENPVSDVDDDEFNDRGFTFDIEEGFRRFG
jgi:hypothetical protein